MDFTFKNIAPYIGFFASFFAIKDIAIHQAKNVINFFKDNETDVFNFYDSIYKGEFNLGETVSVAGFLLNYGQICKPYSYINSVWRPSYSKSMVEHNFKHRGTEHELKSNEILFERNPIIVPAQRIPQINNISYGFLYDERFTGFIRSNFPENIKNTGEMLVKDKYCNPILVVYDKSDYPNIVNNYIYIKKARIIKGQEQVSEYIKQLVDLDESVGLSNIYRPMKLDNDIVCISLLEDNTKVKIVESAINKLGDDFKIPLFAEGTYNLLYDMPLETVTSIISQVAPNDMKYYGQLPSLRDETDNAVSFLSVNKTNITYREPGTIGFYSEVNYFNEEKFIEDFMDYNRLINNFSIDFKNFSHKNYGIKEKFNLTFIYDYSYKNMFKSKYVDTGFNYVKEKEKIHEMYGYEINMLI